MATAFGLPQLAALGDPSSALDQAQLERQAALAKALRAQSMQGLDPNRQIGGMGYNISPWEIVSKAVQGYQASKLEDESDKARQSLAEKQAKAFADAVRGVFGDDTSRAPQAPPNGGRPAGVSAADLQAGGFPQPPEQPQQPVDTGHERRKRAAMSAMLMGNMDLANKIIAGELEQTPEMKNLAFKGVDPRAMGQAELAQARRGGLMTLNPNESVFDPSTNSAKFTAPTAPSPQVQELTQTLSAAGIDPNSPQGQQIFAAFAQKQATHQPGTNVSVNTEKGYAGHVAQGMATQELALVDAARNAPERIQTAQSVKAFLDKNPITGTGAEVRLKFQKALATAGIIDGKTVADTESLQAMLASQTLDAIKTSGLGSGQGFTNTDREFLENARSGRISTNPETLRRTADLNERAAQATLNRGNDVIKKWRANPSLAPMAPDIIMVPEPPKRRASDTQPVLRFDAQGNLIQ